MPEKLTDAYVSGHVVDMNKIEFADASCSDEDCSCNYSTCDDDDDSADSGSKNDSDEEEEDNSTSEEPGLVNDEIENDDDDHKSEPAYSLRKCENLLHFCQQIEETLNRVKNIKEEDLEWETLHEEVEGGSKSGDTFCKSMCYTHNGRRKLSRRQRPCLYDHSSILTAANGESNCLKCCSAEWTRFSPGCPFFVCFKCLEEVQKYVECLCHSGEVIISMSGLSNDLRYFWWNTMNYEANKNYVCPTVSDRRWKQKFKKLSKKGSVVRKKPLGVISCPVEYGFRFHKLLEEYADDIKLMDPLKLRRNITEASGYVRIVYMLLRLVGNHYYGARKIFDVSGREIREKQINDDDEVGLDDMKLTRENFNTLRQYCLEV